MRNVLIGLDGADWQVLEPLLNAGKMPTLGHLVDTGCMGVMQSTVPPHSPPAWASMITGVNPGKHGIWGFTKPSEDYRNVPIEPMNELGAVPIWRILNIHGKTTGIVNLPILYPPESVQGFLVCGMLTPKTATVFTHPSKWSQVIGDPGREWIIGESLANDGTPENLLEEIRAKTKRQVEITLRLIEEYPTDFLMVVFDGTDKLQHFFWKYWDADHPGYQPRSSEVLRSAMPEYYEELDAHLATIVEKCESSNIFVVSDHGFTGVSKGLYLDQWLVQEGFMRLKPPIARSSLRVIGNGFQWTWRFMAGFTALKKAANNSRAIGALVKVAKRNFRDRAAKLSDGIDWGKTTVFFEGRTSWALRINLKGREESGVVTKEEYDDLIHDLKNRLLNIRDQDGDRSVVASVHHRSELYDGPRVDEAPDLLVVPNKDYAFHEGLSDELLKPFRWDNKEMSGVHRSEGVFIAGGPDIRRLEEPLQVNIMDIAPTLLYLNNLHVPNYVDGVVLTQLMKEEVIRDRPVEFTNEESLIGSGSSGYTVEEESAMEEHLRALGYL